MKAVLRIALLVSLVGVGAAQRNEEPAPPYHGPEYVRSEVMIPVRDGVKLHTVIVRPKGSEKEGPALPFLMQRTPYGVASSDGRSVQRSKTLLAESGYIFVYQDIRGRYASGGQFVMNRPIVKHTSSTDVDETTDTRDTIDWLLKKVPNNSGKVGVLGVSYPGFLAMMAGIDAHPAVKAISPQAPMTDVWLGDDFFHNGAFRETYGFDYVVGLESSKENTFNKLDQDGYDYFLQGGSYLGVAKVAKIDNLPTSKSFLEHPAYDNFWQARAVERQLKRAAVPTLLVGGWWDQEDMWGTQAEYAALEPHDSAHQNFLVLGPWKHGGWGGGARQLGDLDFGAPVGDQFRQQFEAPFFAHYLKDENGFDLEDTAAFPTGVDRWKR